MTGSSTDTSRQALETSIPTPLLAYSLDLQKEYEAGEPLSARKKKGQFFTPPEVCRFMASLFSLEGAGAFRLLDPGAGVGALSAAVCDSLAAVHPARRIELHAFENDVRVMPLLHRVMQECQRRLRECGHSMTYQVHEQDFILDAAATVFGEPSLFGGDSDFGQFDAVVMNPPYFKVGKTSQYARVMDDVVHGQPNMYAFFLAAAAQMLRPGGELVGITPRSFCNGLYFRDFRHWFFQRMSLDHIHLFESRTDTFRNVLQESVITAWRRLGKPADSITVSASQGLNSLALAKRRNVAASSIIDNTRGQAVVRIPASELEQAIAGIVESWPDRFTDLGLRVSTGPVVMFRATEFLLDEPNGKETAPLLSVFHVKPFKTEWPLRRPKKFPAAFKVCFESRRLLLPVQNYVLMRRFSAKEERRRLTASCLVAGDFTHPFVALENHLNYVYHAERELTVDETYGIAALFNSALLDRYFRTLSGNTQVNATELRTMNFPGLTAIAAIGNRVKNLLTFDDPAIESAVFQVLGIDAGIGAQLLEGSLLF